MCICFAFLIFETIFTIIAPKTQLLYSAVAVLVDVIYSYKAEFKEHAAATESVAMQTAIETGSLIDEVLAWVF